MFYMLLLLTSLIVFIQWYIKSKRHPIDFPPGPRLPLPIIGDAYKLGKDMTAGIKFLTEKHGKIVGFWLGPRRAVAISDFNVLQNILNRPETADRQFRVAFRKLNIKLLLIHIFIYLNSQFWSSFLMQICILAYLKRGYSLGGIPGILFSNWMTCIELRRESLHILKDFGYGKNAHEDIIEEEVDNLVKYIDDNWVETPLDVSQFFNIAVLASLWRILTGETLKIGDPKLNDLMSSVKTVGKEIGLPFVNVAMNFLTLFKFLNHIGMIGMQKSTNELFEYCSKVLRIHKDKLIDGENPLTFTEALLHKIQITKDPSHPLFGKLGELNLLNILIDLFIAGSDTTSNTLNWSMLYMIQNPDIQNKVREELFTNIGNKKAKMSERYLTPYTEAVLHEVSRKGNILPLGGFHQTNNLVNAGQYIIPSKTVIIPLIGQIMNDPEHFPNPSKFNPNRYLSMDEKENVKFTPHPRIIPFGVGKRKCLGEVIARTSLYKFFTTIIQKYKIVSGQDQPIFECRSLGFVTAPKPYKLKFVKI